MNRLFVWLFICFFLGISFGDPCSDAYGIGSTCSVSCDTVSDNSPSLCSGGQVCCTNFYVTNSFEYYNPEIAPWQKIALDRLQETLKWYLEYREFSCRFRNKTSDGTYCGGEDGNDEIKMSNVATYYSKLPHQIDSLNFLEGTLLKPALVPSFQQFVKDFRNVGAISGPDGFLPPAPKGTGTACSSPQNGYQGICIDYNQCTGATFNGRCPGGSNILCCSQEKTPAFPQVEYLTSSTFARLFNGIGSVRGEALRPYLNEALGSILRDNPSSFTRCHRIAAFVAQIGHESLGLRYFEEIATGADYEGRCRDLGNCQPGDGVRFKGRGPIQLTGRANYQSASRSLNTDWESKPDKVCFPSAGFQAATWFWNKNNLNRFTTGNFNDFTALSRTINGGLNGIEDRRNRWATAKSLLGCDSTSRASSYVLELAGLVGNETDPASIEAAQSSICSDSSILKPFIFLGFLMAFFFFF